MVRTAWRKSSFSEAEVNCVEVSWRKSTFSDAEVNCVEVAHSHVLAAIRDSKNRSAGHLTLAPAAYLSLLRAAKRS